MSLILFALLVIIAVGFYASRNPQDPSNTATSESSRSEQVGSNASERTAATDPSVDARTVTFDGSSFVPETITVGSGDIVTFTNTSNEDLQLASDPHPSHTANSELNAGSIAPGESREVTLTNKGDWGYHNHLDPTDTALVQVR